MSEKTLKNQQHQQRRKNAHLEEYPACIGRILNECQHSYALHPRRIKELVLIRRQHSETFAKDLWKTLRPAFQISKREPCVERIVKFAASFAAYRDEKHGDECDSFLEEFFGLLLFYSDASHKAVRFRSCQMLSEIIIRLPDNAEVSNELWDDVISCMQRRMRDKISIVRVFAVRALARFANDVENSNIVDLYRDAIASEQNAEVRKMLVLSMPASNDTAVDIIQRTLDVNDSVRKAAYRVLANKFPIQSLSIKQRNTILRRGLADRVPSVTTECVKMLKDAWFSKCCGGDPIVLLKFLDVETNESMGEAVMEEILKDGLFDVKDPPNVKQFVVSENTAGNDGNYERIKLMNAETALYWRMLCRYLQIDAQETGSDAAQTHGAEAVVYAAAAEDKNEMLETALPSSIADYVALLEAHLSAGPNYRYVSRQLLLLGLMLDYSDAASRKIASSFLQKLFYKPTEYIIDEEDGKDVVIGDGISIGGDREWASAVTELARKVHASAGEFENVVCTVVAELASPCREGGANFLQWMHCLAMTGLLLENITSLQKLQGRAIEAPEILHGLLLPAAKHIHQEVRRAAIRCLGLYGLRERQPSEEVVRQLRLGFCKGPASVRKMAVKAIFDLCMWHGPKTVDRVTIKTGLESTAVSDGSSDASTTTESGGEREDGEDDSSLTTLDLLSSALDRDEWSTDADTNDTETTWSIVTEGFAKLLLQSKRYPAVLSMQCSLFTKLISLYFSEETKDMHRLRQCLSVFLDQYPALSVDHKKCISKSFLPVMRAVWPGVYGNPSGNPHTVSALRKRASNISLFMLELLKTPLYNIQNVSSANAQDDGDSSADDTDEVRPRTKETQPELDAGIEELAIRIGIEVASFPSKRTAAGKHYLAALCRVVVLLDLRSSQQEAIKCIRRLLNHMVEAVSGDKQVVKELEGMITRLKNLDKTPDEGLSNEQLKFILDNLELEKNIDIQSIIEDPIPVPAAKTPAPRKATTRGRSRRPKTPDSCSPLILATATPCTSRAQRTSKTAALGKMKSSMEVKETDDLDEEELHLISKMSEEEYSDSTDTDYEVEGDEEVESALRKRHAKDRKNCPVVDNESSDETSDKGNSPKTALKSNVTVKSKSCKKTFGKLPETNFMAYEEDESLEV